MLKILIIFSLFLIPSHAAYDYYKLAQQWPPTFCANQQGTNKPCKPNYIKLSAFKIHGLWPQNYSGAAPTVCQLTGSKPMPPERNIPTTLHSALTLDWPNLLTPTDYKFWEAEWDKHGKCSSLSNNPLDYFQLALDIQKRDNLFNILTTATPKVVPNKFYPKNQFNVTIFNKIHAYPELSCLKGPNNIDQLVEIRLCLDHSGASYINCTGRSISCGTNIFWPL